MPLNVSDCFLKTVKGTLKLAPFKVTLSNPFFTALLITLIIIIIILIVFRNEKFKYNSLSKLTLKVGVYSIIIISMFIFLNNYSLIKEMDEKTSLSDTTKSLALVDETKGGLPYSEEDIVPVK